MSHMIIIRELDYKPQHIHIVELPESPRREAYWQLSSLNGFRRRERNRQSDQTFLIMFPDEWEWKSKQFPYEWLSLPESHHASLWDFYAAISYDHRRDRYP